MVLQKSSNHCADWSTYMSCPLGAGECPHLADDVWPNFIDGAADSTVRGPESQPFAQALLAQADGWVLLGGTQIERRGQTTTPTIRPAY
eukprot:9503531-Pyramimonas_sp.AAC.1